MDIHNDNESLLLDSFGILKFYWINWLIDYSSEPKLKKRDHFHLMNTVVPFKENYLNSDVF